MSDIVDTTPYKNAEVWGDIYYRLVETMGHDKAVVETDKIWKALKYERWKERNQRIAGHQDGG